MHPKLYNALKEAIINKSSVKELEQNIVDIITTEHIDLVESAEVLLQYQDYLISSSNVLSDNFNINI